MTPTATASPDLVAVASWDVASLEGCGLARATNFLGAADLDHDGFIEVIHHVDDAVWAWTPASGVERLAWDYATDAYAWDGGYYLDDAFGPDRPGLVVRTDPLVIVPLGG